MRFKRLFALLTAAVMLLTFCSCGRNPDSETLKETIEETEKYSDMPLSGEDTEIGVHDDEYGFHIVNRIEFTHPRAYESKHVAHSYQSLWKDSQKEIYDKVVNACYCFSDEKVAYENKYQMRPVILKGMDYQAKELEAAIIAAFDDHPEIFWMDYQFEWAIDNETDTTSLTLRSYYTADEVVGMMKRIDDVLKTFYAEIPENMSEYEREVYVYKYIIDHCEYDDNITSSEEYENEHPSLFNLFGVLVDQKAVCEGYAYTFDYLCSELGIDTVCICGTSENDDDEMLHLWNAVVLDNEWYMADVTWDDLDEDEDVKGVYIYLNVTEKMMELDHTLDKTYAEISDEDYSRLECYINNFLPSMCTATEYCYCLREGVTLSGPDVDMLSEGIVKTAQKDALALIVNVDSDTYTPKQLTEVLFEGNQPYYEAMEKASAQLGNSTLDVQADAVYYYYDDRNLIAFEMPYNN